MLEVRISPNRGRGVFVNKDVCANTVLHVDYSRLLNPNDISLIDQTSISGHWFDNPDNFGHGLLPIGLVGLINHSTNPNAKITWKNNNLGYIGILVAITDIVQNSEIFIDYGIDTPQDWC